MATFEMKEGQVMIFKNNKKQSEKHPDYNGKIMIEGKEKSFSLWIKEGKSGKYISGKVNDDIYNKSIQEKFDDKSF